MVSLVHVCRRGVKDAKHSDLALSNLHLAKPAHGERLRGTEHDSVPYQGTMNGATTTYIIMTENERTLLTMQATIVARDCRSRRHHCENT